MFLLSSDITRSRITGDELIFRFLEPSTKNGVSDRTFHVCSINIMIVTIKIISEQCNITGWGIGVFSSCKKIVRGRGQKVPKKVLDYI